MKKIFVLVFLIIGIFITFNENVISWVKSNFASNPTPYFQQRQDFFKKLSKEYYGVSDYGEELEAINRTFRISESSTERIDLIIPSLDAIDRLKQRRTVASIENDSYTQTVEKNPLPITNRKKTESVLEKNSHIKSSTVILLISVIFISTIISLMGYLKYRRKRRRLTLLKISDDEPIITDDSILLDFNLFSFEEKKTKPDSTYLKKVT
jgi:hypothetical protein